MKNRNVLPALLAMFLVACGSGGGGGGGGSSSPAPAAPPPNNLTYNLSNQILPAPGYTRSYTLSGSDSAGGQYTGTFTTTALPKTTLSGQTVTPVNSLFDITNTANGAFVSVLVTDYLSDSGVIVLQIDNSTGVSYQTTVVSIPPTSVKVGDFGLSSTLTGSDGSTMTGTWKLTAASGDLANLVASETLKDAAGTTIVTTELTTTIDVNGDQKSITARFYYPDSGITLNLSGSRIP